VAAGTEGDDVRTEPLGAIVVVLCLFVALPVLGATAGSSPLELRSGWALASSADVAGAGDVISRPGFDTRGWHRASVPTTVVSALVADGTFPDPYTGTNLRRIPGASYTVGDNFSVLPMPEDSPFRVPWWYRTEFDLPAALDGRTRWLRLDGVNYRFEAWLNGTRVADREQTAGAFRVHEIDVTRALRRGRNALAIRVETPRPNDLAITFVDWNPMPPDRDMGVWRGVTLTASGSVALRHPQVVTRLEPGAPLSAALTVKVFATNATAAPVRGTLRGRIGAIAFAEPVRLAAGESREIVVDPVAHPGLVVKHPRLWWPYAYGTPVLHSLDLEMVVNGRVSDRSASRFGIREFTSELTPAGHRLYRVNGRKLLVRGAGWSFDMMLRSSPRRQEAELAYVKAMGLNTVRLEGKLEDDHFLDVADREGILVMPGWCCCDHWEQWGDWKDEELPVALASLRDQVLRLRGRACVFTWLNGSDGPPPASIENAYLAVLGKLGFPDPVVSSASSARSAATGASGMKMLGPYEWVPPVYWYADTSHGGAFGLATEIGPGPSPPPLESLRRFIPAGSLWPLDSVWSYHCGGGVFATTNVFDTAMAARYGPSSGIDDYARTAQVAAYESHRAMFESDGARKYGATGVIQWMLGNAWPSLIWHLYDWYLRPGGAYFGAKKACEPLHVQFGYDDRSVVVVNSTLRDARGLSVTARVLDTSGAVRFARTVTLDSGADSVAVAFRVPEPEGTGPTYFLSLALADAAGRAVSRNDYWLSTAPDVPDPAHAQWYVTPVRGFANLTGLRRLPAATVSSAATFTSGRGEGRARVVLVNRSNAVAFFVRAAVRRAQDGEEVLPVLWDDNFVTLYPGERRVLTARWALRDLAGRRPRLGVEGWNLATSP
jgi:exo-1,4-beta-D-glucosaminidase